MSKTFMHASIMTTLILTAAAAQAHHSYAMFDQNRKIVVDGTLYALEWKNPHAWVWVKGKDAAGKEQTFGFEGGSPAALARQGYTKAKLKVGTRVRVTYNPLRDGRPGGSLVNIEFDPAAS